LATQEEINSKSTVALGIARAPVSGKGIAGTCFQFNSILRSAHISVKRQNIQQEKVTRVPL